jgi:hypothetical protein
VSALCESLGCRLDLEGGPAALSASLGAAAAAAPPALASLIRSLATRAMSEAHYFCTGGGLWGGGGVEGAWAALRCAAVLRPAALRCGCQRPCGTVTGGQQTAASGPERDHPLAPLQARCRGWRAEGPPTTAWPCRTTRTSPPPSGARVFVCMCAGGVVKMPSALSCAALLPELPAPPPAPLPLGALAHVALLRLWLHYYAGPLAFPPACRRYADVVAHRQLLAAVAAQQADSDGAGAPPASPPLPGPEVAARAAVMNERHRAAKRAAKACSELYLLLLLHAQVGLAGAAIAAGILPAAREGHSGAASHVRSQCTLAAPLHATHLPCPPPPLQPHVEAATIYALHPSALLLFLPRYHLRGVVHLADRAGVVRPPLRGPHDEQEGDPLAAAWRRGLALVAHGPGEAGEECGCGCGCE